MQGTIAGSGVQRIRVAAAGPRNVARSLVVSLRSEPPQRGMMLRAMPLVALGAVAFTAGALVAPRDTSMA
jgi:hypothetical protein